MIIINTSSVDGAGLFQPFLPIYIPMGIGYLLAVCEREGIVLHLVDQQIERDARAKIRGLVPLLKPPYIFGFSVLTGALGPSLTLARELKREYPGSMVIFGGIHPTAEPEECLAEDCVDAVVRGEADEIFPELYRRLKSSGDWRSLDGVSYRANGTYVHNRQRYVMDLDSLPVFPYHRFDPARYSMGFVMSSRGCPYECIFCSNRLTTGKCYRFRSAAIVLEELRALVEDHGIRRVYFLDDNFLVHKSRVAELVRGIKERGWHRTVEFSFQGRADNADPVMLRELFEAGFRNVAFGIETASPVVMARIKKGETLDEIVAAVRMAKEIGFYVSSSFIFGLPGETSADRSEAVRLSRDIGLDMVKFNNAIPYPGTEFCRIAAEEGRLNIVGRYENFNSVGTFTQAPWDEKPLPYVPQGSTEAGLRDDILWAYWKAFFNVRKFREIFLKPKDANAWFGMGDNFIQFLGKVFPLLVMFVIMFIKYAGLFFRSGRRALCNIFVKE
jgi:radical SAM superfamily enzyme YgiQ (UPF0313 family)